MALQNGPAAETADTSLDLKKLVPLALARIEAIIRSPEGKANPELAVKLATDGVPADEALAKLRAAPNLA
ncbi:hypothetical protein [Thioclava pacifica]|uniref:Uncharacterized protein n=1 Tax=Thioclava pacifica DSM 10166 TaxID=1353537 RepID=A0A074JA31_9RHOB|nr:hypothetical protein [Thioclava pacifica]KEO53409.1 hypothetical protein TP2_17925 [Thioclava pacifica DSM 10166]